MQNNQTARQPDEMVPLNPIVLAILDALFSKTLHGYEIKKRVEADLRTVVPTATLYRHLKAMREDGLIEDVAPPIPDDDPRRQYFKITAFGQRVYGTEYNRLRLFVGSREGLLGQLQIRCPV